MVADKPTPKLCQQCNKPRSREARRFCWPCAIANRTRGDAVARFWRSVEKTDGCWLWTLSTKAKGYGQFFTTRGNMVLAHRYAYELTYGPIPNGLSALHCCDNPRCVRPDHLFLGTRADNNRDMEQKGRAHKVGPKGERSAGAKLTSEAVRTIRAECAAGAPVKQLAERFHVSTHPIYEIKHGRAWKHVK